MKITLAHTRSFPAAHSYGTGVHKGPCGHLWTLEIAQSVDLLDPDYEDIRNTGRRILDGLVDELYGRDVNRQLPASVPDTVGIAAWAYERADMLVKGLAWVRCSIENEISSVTPND